MTKVTLFSSFSYSSYFYAIIIERKRVRISRHFRHFDEQHNNMWPGRGPTSNLALFLSSDELVGRRTGRIHPVGAAGMALSELTAPPRQAARATGAAQRQRTFIEHPYFLCKCVCIPLVTNEVGDQWGQAFETAEQSAVTNPCRGW